MNPNKPPVKDLRQNYTELSPYKLQNSKVTDREKAITENQTIQIYDESSSGLTPFDDGYLSYREQAKNEGYSLLSPQNYLWAIAIISDKTATATREPNNFYKEADTDSANILDKINFTFNGGSARLFV